MAMMLAGNLPKSPLVWRKCFGEGALEKVLFSSVLGKRPWRI